MTNDQPTLAEHDSQEQPSPASGRTLCALGNCGHPFHLGGCDWCACEVSDELAGLLDARLPHTRPLR